MIQKQSQSIKKQSNRIEKKLDIFDNIKETITQKRKTIELMAQKIDKTDLEVKELREENEKLERELKKQNPIFTGIPDEETEDDIQCLEKVKQIISSTLKLKSLSLDTAHRLGKFNDGKTRPKKVEVIKNSDRQKIWNQRSNLPQPL